MLKSKSLKPAQEWVGEAIDAADNIRQVVLRIINNRNKI